MLCDASHLSLPFPFLSLPFLSFPFKGKITGSSSEKVVSKSEGGEGALYDNET